MVSLVGYASGTGGPGSIAVPAHSAGDVIVFVNGGQTATPPATTAGFTSLATGTETVSGTSRSARAQFIVSDGSITSVTREYYGLVWVLSGAAGARAVSRQANVTTTSIAIPVLSGLDTGGLSYLIACTYAPGVLSSVTSPWTAASSSYAYITNNSSSSSPSSTTITTSGSTGDIAFTIEVTPRRATATAAITEENDTAAGTAQLKIRASAAITEENDVVYASNRVTRFAEAANVEDDDVVAGAAKLRLSASAAITEANDVASGAASVAYAATIRPGDTITFPTNRFADNIISFP